MKYAKLLIAILIGLIGVGGFAAEDESVRSAEAVIRRFAGSRHENNVLLYKIEDASIGNNSCNLVITCRTKNSTDSTGVIEIVPKKR